MMMVVGKRFRGTGRMKGDNISKGSTAGSLHTNEHLEVAETERECEQDRKRIMRPTVIQSRRGRKRARAGGRGCCAHV